MVVLNVYGDSKSTCTQRVLILLEELELKYNFQEIDLSKGEHKTNEHVLKNPFGKVPIIEYGNKFIYESRTIMRYIAKNNRENDLYGNIYTDMWMEVESNYFNKPVSNILMGKMFKKGSVSDEDIQANLVEFERVLDTYNTQLEGKEYLTGDEYTIADITHIPCAYYFLKAGYKSVLKKRMNVYNWLKRVSLRPAVQKVINGNIQNQTLNKKEEIEKE